MRSLAGQKRPGPSLAPLNVRTAIGPLTIAVVVVATPAGTRRSLRFEICIDNPQAFRDQWIAGGINSITDQLQKTRVDNIASRIRFRRARRLAGQLEIGRVNGAWLRDFPGLCRIQAHKVA